LTLNVALTTVLRTNVLHCDNCGLIVVLLKKHFILFYFIVLIVIIVIFEKLYFTG